MRHSFDRWLGDPKADGRPLFAIFDEHGRAIRQTDGKGRYYEMAYDHCGNMVTVTDFFGRIMQLYYTSTKQLQGFRDWRDVHYECDERGFFLPIVDPDAERRE